MSREAPQFAVRPQARPAEREAGEAPLSFGQERLWFLDRTLEHKAAYIIPGAVRVAGDFDLDRLDQAFTELVKRHESLRTRFVERAGQVSQVIDPPTPFAFERIDLSALSASDRQATIDQLSLASVLTTFDLGERPLLRGSVLRLGPRDHLILLAIHHIVSDAWSMGVVIAEFSALYEALSDGRTSPLVPLPTQYADYALWQRDHLQGEVLDRHAAYWRSALADAPATSLLPTDRPRLAFHTYQGERFGFVLGEGLSSRILRLARDQRVTPFMVLTAAFQLTLSRWSGRDDVVIGTPIAGRRRSELEGLIGFFVNSIAIRARPDPGLTVGDYLAQVRATAVAAYAHQDLPFEKVVKAVQARREVSHSPIFQIMLAFQNTPRRTFDLDQLSISLVRSPPGPAKFELSLVVEQDAQLLDCTFEYAADLFDAATIERLAVHLERVLEQMTASPAVRLAEIELLSAAERADLLVWTDPTAEAYLRLLAQRGALPPPAPDAQVYVLDDRGAIQPVGVFGDLCCGGRGVTDAALDAAEPEPHGGADARMLRTGDRGRWRNDGTLEIVAAPPSTDALAPDEGEGDSGVEAVLVGVWSEVLRRDDVGRHDNFFELGGDSIQCIQIVSAARRAGVRVTVRQMFERQTIAELARVATAGVPIDADQGRVVGDVPLTPIQRQFVETVRVDPHHYNQALILSCVRAVDPDHLEGALRCVVAHHDALSLRLGLAADGWRQWCAPEDQAVLVERIDLSALAGAEREAVFRRDVARIQGSLDLAEGPLLRGALVTASAGDPQEVVFVIHHLAVDGVSWRILIQDLEAAYRRLEEGATPSLPLKTTSYKAWADRLAAYAETPKAQEELSFWRDVIAGAERLPANGAGPALVEAERRIDAQLDAEETRALLHDVPPVYHTQINDHLLTCLMTAVSEVWGVTALSLDLEGHGREDLFEDVDLSRTVGWFTSQYPIRLDITGAADMGDALQRVKEQLRAIPNRGVNYGVIRYLCQAPELDGAPADVCFNYLGQIDHAVGEAAIFRSSFEGVEPMISPAAPRAHRLEVLSWVADDRLTISLRYAESTDAPQTIEALARALVEQLRALIEHCRESDGGYTLSDFELLDF